MRIVLAEWVVEMSLRRLCAVIGLIGIALASHAVPDVVRAQANDEASHEAVRIPNFWDPQTRMERPDPQEVGAIRFLTVDDFPPFSFRDRRGMLIGFNVDLAVEVCRILKVECAIQFRPFATLEPALRQGAGDAVIAGLGTRLAEEQARKAALAKEVLEREASVKATQTYSNTTDPEAPKGTAGPSASQSGPTAAGSASGQERVIQTIPSGGAASVQSDALANASQPSASVTQSSAAQAPPLPEELLFTQPYFKLPARFVTQKDKSFDPNTADGAFVGVACESAHEAFLGVFFPDQIAICYPDLVTGLRELQEGRLDAVFGDALGLAFWMHGPESKDCCTFVSGPFLNDEFFSEGLTIAVRPDARLTRDALDYAMREVHRSGKYKELYLRYFPIGLF